VLIEAAHGAAHTKHTYLTALSRREPYQDLGANYFDERDRQAVQRRLVRRLE
jgi:hypothetical protein